ncbi:MAG: hypothetical protein CMP23_05080 [Rickettsiales bacterium]|nr:hypothetical protein [Rickettsiales bacterium]|tara:strand:+ start:36 stop:584 length:549 start_codon:yes stop_codon:yes gene_type:complete
MSSPLLIKLAELPEQGLQIQVDQTEARFASALTGANEGEHRDHNPSGEASVTIKPWPDRVDVEGSLRASLGAGCSRCAASFSQPVERGFFRVYLREPPQNHEEEVELSRSDLDRDLLPDNELDLGELLAEELVLALPTKPLCMADCKGICSGCGAELNHRECSCEPETDDRWASLKALKLKD